MALEKGVKKAAWVTWDYAAGNEAGAGFKEGLEKHGGKVVTELKLPFPQTNFQPLLAQVPGLEADVRDGKLTATLAARRILETFGVGRAP